MAEAAKIRPSAECGYDARTLAPPPGPALTPASVNSLSGLALVLVNAISSAVIGLGTAIARVVSSQFDTSFAQSPAAYALFAMKSNDLTPGNPVEIQNTSDIPLWVFAQSVANVSAGTRSFLFVGPTKEGVISGVGPCLTVFDVAPQVSVVVPPNKTIWIDGTDPQGGTAAFKLNTTQVSLQGRGSVFTKG